MLDGSELVGVISCIRQCLQKIVAIQGALTLRDEAIPDKIEDLRSMHIPE